MREQFFCPECDAECWREEVDVGVGYVYSPWHCDECGWIEYDPYANDLNEFMNSTE